MNLLASCGLQGDALRAAAAETGLPDAPGILQKLITVCTFSPEIQAGLLQETIPFAMAFDLARQDRATAALLVSLGLVMMAARRRRQRA